jgi:hypothetical protein
MHVYSFTLNIVPRSVLFVVPELALWPPIVLVFVDPRHLHAQLASLVDVYCTAMILVA